jgi:hypothetical protein
MLPVGLARDRKQPLTHPPATRSDLLLAVVAVGVGAAAVAVVDEAGGGHEEGAVVVVAGALAVELAGAEVDVLRIARGPGSDARGPISDMCSTAWRPAPPRCTALGTARHILYSVTQAIKGAAACAQ